MKSTYVCAARRLRQFSSLHGVQVRLKSSDGPLLLLLSQQSSRYTSLTYMQEDKATVSRNGSPDSPSFVRRCRAHPFITATAVLAIMLLALAITLAVYIPHRHRGVRADDGTSHSDPTDPIAILAAPPPTSFLPVKEAFVSFAIEFAFFPNFAGLCYSCRNVIVSFC